MTQKTPRAFITDGLPAYAKSAKRIFGRKTHHVSNVGINSKRTGQKIHPTNNMMERLNGEIRDREKVFRGLKKKDTPLIAGLKIWYNFSKEHGGLGGDVTPSEAALIKRLTVITNGKRLSKMPHFIEKIQFRIPEDVTEPSL